jgi:hypothetical protein
MSVLQVHIVAGYEYSWAIMTNLGHITGPLLETYSSWVNCPKEKIVSADLMHLFLVPFVTVRLTL